MVMVTVREMATGLWRHQNCWGGFGCIVSVSMPKLVGVGVITDDLGGEHEGRYKQPMI